MSRPLVVGLAMLECASAAQAICTANASAPVACQAKVPRRSKVQITRDDYMQALELSRPISGENVIPPGQPGCIRHLAPFVGEADSHMGDHAELFRTFHYKPMRLNPR